jgi:hypothetical protein
LLIYTIKNIKIKNKNYAKIMQRAIHKKKKSKFAEFYILQFKVLSTIKINNLIKIIVKIKFCKFAHLHNYLQNFKNEKK